MLLGLVTASTYGQTPTTNPAELERDAVAQLQGRDELVRVADDLNTLPLDGKVAEYLERRRPVLDLLRQAAVMPQADWGEPTADLAPVMVTLQQARTAVRLTWLAARYDLSVDRPADAVDDLLAGMALARHVGQQKLIVSHLVEAVCESGAIDRLAAILPTLPKDVVATLPARLDALPPRAGLAAVIDGERALSKLMQARQLNAPAIPPAPPGPPPLTPEARAEADQKAGREQAQAAAGQAMMAAQYNELGAVYDAAKDAAEKSPDAFAAALDKAVASMPNNVLAKVLVPGLARAREPSAVSEAKLAMLRVAVDAATRGQTAIDESADPAGTGPFDGKAAAGTYTLRSKLTHRGKPVTLVVGK